MIKTIKVADNFPYPGPRFRRLGPQSGEEFKYYLYEILTDFYGSGFNNNINTRILIDLDGTRGYGSSFLEEGFGGLIRMGIPDSIIKLITIKTNEEPELEDEINSYIDDARNSIS
ncbi:STAS-like domain-containing protein [Aeromonas salmonicida]|uniref:STAS-like domain-containing protein n=1 Tax=Aeromonas salmonicida TaxID=645 RepID=UPI00259FDAE3|nr:STAS-like domain-containing protein [Aeromonas salmonicida]MDM5112862.1 STAS-like domain-containing protein [Aeromonas salmonicida]